MLVSLGGGDRLEIAAFAEHFDILAGVS